MNSRNEIESAASLLSQAGYRPGRNGLIYERVDHHGNRHPYDNFEISPDGTEAVRHSTGEAMDLATLKQWLRHNIPIPEKPLSQQLWDEPAVGFVFANPVYETMPVEDALSHCTHVSWHGDTESLTKAMSQIEAPTDTVFLIAPKLRPRDVDFVLENTSPEAKHSLCWDSSMEGEANAAVFSLEKAGRRSDVFIDGEELAIRDFSSVRQTTFPNYREAFGFDSMCSILGIEDANVKRLYPDQVRLTYGGGQSPYATTGGRRI